MDAESAPTAGWITFMARYGVVIEDQLHQFVSHNPLNAYLHPRDLQPVRAKRKQSGPLQNILWNRYLRNLLYIYLFICITRSRRSVLISLRLFIFHLRNALPIYVLFVDLNKWLWTVTLRIIHIKHVWGQFDVQGYSGYK